jgi:hypothetical protein
MKKFYKSDKGEFHFGDVMINGFALAKADEIEKALTHINRKLWRCTVCNDLYIGQIPPKQCPTCSVIDAYIEINEKEFREMMK